MAKYKKIISILLCTSIAISGCSKAGSGNGTVSSSTTNSKTEADNINQIGELEKEEQNARRYQALYAALLPMWDNSGKYPSKWDMSLFYKDEAAFYKDYDDVEKWIDTLSTYEGSLNNKDSIYDFFHAIEDDSMKEKYNTMLMYCELGKSLDISDEYYIKLDDSLKQLENDYDKAISFAQSEIMEMPYEERLEIFEDPAFDDMTTYLQYYKADNAGSLSKDEKNEIADMKLSQGSGIEAYENLRYNSFPAADFVMPDSQTVKLTSDVYNAIIQGSYDRDTKISAYIAYADSFKNQSDAFASFLQTTMNENWEMAQAYGYDTTLEMALDDENLDTAVFENVIKAAAKASKEYARYIKLHKDALSIDEQYMFDLDTSASSIPAPIYPYDDSIDLIKNATSVLGDDYVEVLSEIVEGGNIDSSQGENRSGASYCMAAGRLNMPHVFVNFYGEYRDASNLSHELGHAVNYRMTAQNQPIWYTRAPIYNTEVCSIMNEILFNAYMVKNSDSDEKKLFYLEKLLDLYDSAFFSQCMYSELEDYMYKIVESGKELNGDDICDKMGELFIKYRGEDVYCEDSAWMVIDHLHYCYYMYKYATAICYASSLASDILSGNEATINRYKEYMKTGSSLSPMEALKVAGIDPMSDKTYDSAIKYYTSLVDEYEKLIK